MRYAAAALALVALAACRDEPKPVPLPAESSAPSSALKPLSSRDGATARSLPTPSGDTLPPGHPPVSRGSGSTEGAVTGKISIGPSVASRVVPNEVLFIVARSAGTREVLAVRKEEGARFPFEFQISGADAMVDGTKFAGPFDITARISKSGDAIPAPGDIEGVARGVATGAAGVAIALDSVRQ